MSFNRGNIDYKNLRQFTCTSTDYNKQFYQVYLRRLEELRPILVSRAVKKWPNVQLVKLPELETLENERCIIIGTVFKQQHWKPSILRDLSDESPPPLMQDNYCSEKDQLFLEDEMLRVKIAGSKTIEEFVVTGIVCALLGKKLEDGSFEIKDWCLPGCPPPSPAPLVTTGTNGKILFISSLDLANNRDTLSLNLLLEWICGIAGTPSSQADMATVVNVVIAGNSVKSGGGSGDNHKEVQQLNKGLNSAKAQENAISSEIVLATKKLDELLTEIVPCCNVILMPGQYDPTNLMLPQKPIQPFMLRESCKHDKIKSVGNPWNGTVGNRLISGSSGQPIEDIQRVSSSSEKSPLYWLEKTLDFRHYCPTAPDTLPSYPFHEKDLFIMQTCPDIYFVGNTDEFATKLYMDHVRLICVPKFSTTRTGVLLDLNTLNVELINFAAENN